MLNISPLQYKTVLATNTKYQPPNIKVLATNAKYQSTPRIKQC